MRIRREGGFDRGRLFDAISALLRMHPMLAARLDESGEEAQWLFEGVPEPFVEDFDNDGRVKLEADIEAFRREPLPIGGSLYKIGVWASGEAPEELVFVCHHLIVDGWSARVLFEDFRLAYETSGTARAFSRALPYSKFSAWSSEYPSTAQGREDLEFWRSKLSGLSPFWCLPSRGGALGAAEGPAQETVVDLSLPKGLPPGSSLFELCLSAYFLLLAAYSGRSDPIVVLPVLGRPSREFIGTVGHFANMAAIHLDLEDFGSIADLVEAVGEELRSIKDHALYPFPRLAKELLLEAAEGHQTLSDAYCGMVKLSGSESDAMELCEFRQEGSAWNLCFEIRAIGTRAVAALRYPGGAWKSGQIGIVAGLLATLLRLASESPRTSPRECLAIAGQRLSGIARPESSTLRALGPKRSEGPAPYRKPGTPVEIRLYSIWSEVLGLEGFGAGDDFFALGGHSIDAARVAGRIRRAFGRELPISAIFQHRSIEALGRYLESLPPASERSYPPDRAAAPEFRASGGETAHPLSSSQTRMWFLYRLAPKSASYNMQAAFLVRGVLDLPALSSAYLRLQERHAILRSRFAELKGQPMQVVHPHPCSRLEVVDLTSLSSAEARLRAKELAVAAGDRAYELSAGPPSRLLAIELPGNETVVAMGMHHIVSDQWSWGVVSRDLSELYRAARDSAPARLPPLALQYADYAMIDRGRAASAGALEDAAYWCSLLEGVPPLELRADLPRSADGRGKGGRVLRGLEPGIQESVSGLSADSGRTRSSVYLAAFAVLLWRYSGQTDFPIGIPSANRDDPRYEDLVGTFVNTLVLRFRISPEESFASLLARVGDDLVSATDHGGYAFDRLVEDLRPNRSQGSTPLVQVLFNVVNAPVSLPFGGDLEVEPFVVNQRAVQFELSLNLDEAITRVAEFAYDAGVFEKASIELMADAWLSIIDRASADPGASLSSLVRPSAAELDGMKAEGKMSPVEYPRGRGLASLLWEKARERPEKLALVFGGEEYSYRHLFGLASALALRFDEEGLRPGDFLAIHLERGPVLVASMLAALARGAAYLAIDPAYPEARKAYMLEHSRSALLVCSGKAAPAFPRRIVLDKLPEPSDLGEPLPVGPESPAYLIYTSGSTGQPKGVVIPERALVNFLYSMSREPGFEEEDRLLSVTSPSFDISGLEIFLPLLMGGSVVVASRLESADPRALRAIMRERSISFMQATPASWRMLLEGGWDERIRTILCGGEAFPPDLEAPLLERSEATWNMYGPTETTIWSSMHRVTERDSLIPIGRPIANTRLYVLDDRRELLPPLVVGDLYIAGEGLALGYLHAPELTEAAFVPVPWDPDRRMYRTGDRARLLPSGELDFLGRADAQVKLSGHRIELEEIDAALRSFPGLKDASCAVKDSPSGERRLAAYLVLEKGRAEPDADELDAFLLARLPAYMLPSAYAFVEAIPLGPSGKVDRRALPDMASRAAIEAVPPEGELESLLLAVWREVFAREDFGVTEDFFALGGHSLLAVRLVSAMEERAGLELSLHDFFLHPSIRGCAAAARLPGSPAPQAVNAIRETELLFPMHPGGRREPLFLIAGVFADSDGSYRYLNSLVRNFGPDQPVYMLRPRGLKSAAPLYKDAKAIGEEYAQAIRSVKPRGPYHILGECVGGIHAYETALRLSREGEKVASLILMDTSYPIGAAREALRGARSASARLAAWLAAASRLAAKRRQGQAGSLARKLLAKWIARLLRPDEREELSRRQARVQKRYARLARSYRVRDYAGRVDLIVNARDEFIEPGLGWRGAARGPAELVETIVPGDHVTRLTEHGEATCRTILALMERGRSFQ